MLFIHMLINFMQVDIQRQDQLSKSSLTMNLDMVDLA